MAPWSLSCATKALREAASIQLLSLPATPCRRNDLARFRLSTPLPLRSLIEEFQSLFYRALLLIAIIFPRGNHTDRFPSRAPLQLISWLIRTGRRWLWALSTAACL